MLIFLDFDGVVVDSIEECYVVSRETYYGYAKFPYDEVSYRRSFYQFRGLVRPPHEYMSLHHALEQACNGNTDTIEKLFHNSIQIIDADIKKSFEEKLFFTRSIYKDHSFANWIEMNPLTDFGKTLVGKDNLNIYIVTTKNKEAAEAILNHYDISVSGIYANSEIKSEGSKGKLISRVMNSSNEEQALFVDDAVEHLDTVDDKRVKCCFADWGYGKNNGYQVFHQETWADYI